MMRFYLSVNDGGRIILDTVKHGKRLRTIKARPRLVAGTLISAWQRVRDQISDYSYLHEYGHGYFMEGK